MPTPKFDQEPSPSRPLSVADICAESRFPQTDRLFVPSLSVTKTNQQIRCLDQSHQAVPNESPGNRIDDDAETAWINRSLATMILGFI